LLNRDFIGAAPNQVWLADITIPIAAFDTPRRRIAK
jgi:hypothetical protein